MSALPLSEIASDRASRLKRARCSLDGLSVGDSFGLYTSVGRARVRILPTAPWHYTDDTEMALSIVSILRQFDQIDQDHLAGSFAVNFNRTRGYAMGMLHLLPLIGLGQPWQEGSRSLFRGTGSFGNGGAMRVAPVGGYFADDLAAVVDNARRSAEVTHAHPEGIAGAIAVAVAAAWAYRLRGTSPTRQEFLDRVLPLIPDSEVRNGVIRAREIHSARAQIMSIVEVLGNGSNVSAQDTVPFCLWCAGEQLGNYEESLWLTASGGGDVDTTCAIVGGIVSLYTGIEGIPETWLHSREPLPEWPFGESA